MMYLRSSSGHHLREESRYNCIHMNHNSTMFIQTLTFSGFTNPPETIDGSFNDIFETWLLWSMSLIPSAPPSLLAKKTSSVAGTQIGASCANANVSFWDMRRILAFGPSTSRNTSENTWKKGGVSLVGLNGSELLRKVPLGPRTAKERKSMVWQRS